MYVEMYAPLRKGSRGSYRNGKVRFKVKEVKDLTQEMGEYLVNTFPQAFREANESTYQNRMLRPGPDAEVPPAPPEKEPEDEDEVTEDEDEDED